MLRTWSRRARGVAQCLPLQLSGVRFLLGSAGPAVEGERNLDIDAAASACAPPLPVPVPDAALRGRFASNEATRIARPLPLPPCLDSPQGSPARISIAVSARGADAGGVPHRGFSAGAGPPRDEAPAPSPRPSRAFSQASASDPYHVGSSTNIKWHAGTVSRDDKVRPRNRRRPPADGAPPPKVPPRSPARRSGSLASAGAWCGSRG